LFDKLMAELDALDHAELVTNIAAGEKQFDEGAYKTLEEAEAIIEAFWNRPESDA
jgi:hypothetical protein